MIKIAPLLVGVLAFTACSGSNQPNDSGGAKDAEDGGPQNMDATPDAGTDSGNPDTGGDSGQPDTGNPDTGPPGDGGCNGAPACPLIDMGSSRYMGMYSGGLYKDG